MKASQSCLEYMVGRRYAASGLGPQPFASFDTDTRK
jgi:hypothetical protein